MLARSYIKNTSSSFFRTPLFPEVPKSESEYSVLRVLNYRYSHMYRIKETLINCLYGRIAALRGARNLDYPIDMSRFLRSGRLALHPAQTINQVFHKWMDFYERLFYEYRRYKSNITFFS